MITIEISQINQREKEYICEVLVGLFLGLDYELKVSSKEINQYQFTLENGNQLVFNDNFFKNFAEPLSYLKESSLPFEISYANSPFCPEVDLPILYGSDYLETSKVGNKTRVNCDNDIFAASFFMLTRWEEFVSRQKDSHNRFPGIASFAFRFNLLHRPIVNEYVEFLWNLLKSLGCQQQRRVRKFEIVPTHDVDIPFKCSSYIRMFRELVGDLLKRKNVSTFWLNLTTFLSVKTGLQEDPYDTFDYLMNISESKNLKSYFFFMGGGTSKHDNFYDITSSSTLKLIEKILSRGHLVGLHPSYNTHNDSQQFAIEKCAVETVTKSKVEVGRQHYLNFSVPHTWQIWNDQGMKWDSTLGYPDHEGFRCGVCFPFPVFNVLTRMQLNLWEKPLIVMEATLFRYRDMSIDRATQVVNSLKNTVKKYKGQFVILWHNNSFLPVNKNLKSVYEDWIS